MSYSFYTRPPPPDFRAACDQRFNESCDGKPYLNGIDATYVFIQSGLPKSTLSHIWEQVDEHQNGRLNRDQFALAMWLIELQKTQSNQQFPQYASQPPSYSQMSAPPPPAAQQSYQPHQNNSAWGANAPPTTVKEMEKALICSGCDTGLIPQDIVYDCDVCQNATCERCHTSSPRCQHHVQRVSLQAAQKLPKEDKEGDFGFGLKCDKCKSKLKDGMLCWHCKRCFDPNFCKDCWKDKTKRCKHAAKDKIELRRVGKSSSASDILDAVDVVGSILG